MNEFIAYLSRIFSSWKFWIVVPPWDVGVRVRLGKLAKAMRPGLHFRLPMVDEITLVNTRLRICSTPTQTLPGSSDNRTRSISVTIGYRIVDPLASMMAYTSPETALSAFVQAKVAEDGSLLAEHCLEALLAEFPAHGVEVDFVYAIKNVEVRTYRIIGGAGGSLWSGQSPVNFVEPASGSAPSLY